MMEHYERNPYLEEINAGIAGIVSLIANCTLLYATSKVKSYSDTVRWSQYNFCLFRLLFSGFVIVTAPTIIYFPEINALYIVKGGIPLPREIGVLILNLFVVFVVTSCTGPMIQYLQVAYVLSNPALKSHCVLRTLLSLSSLFVAIPTFILILIGYTPSQYEAQISEDFIREISLEEESTYLMAPEDKIFNAEAHKADHNHAARICTIFIFTVMIFSVLVIILCFSHIQSEMRKKTRSNQTLKSQRQVNILLMVQFIFPFFTIHIPFYTAFIMPYVDLEFEILSANLPYLFSWSPAINPILVIFLVKNVRDTLPCRKKIMIRRSTIGLTLTPNARNSLSLTKYKF